MYYLVTIKCVNMRYTSRDEIDTIVNKVVKKLKDCEWTAAKYELDSQQRWHVHIVCHCRSTRQPYWKLLQRKNWTINAKEFPESDIQTVVSYINKDSQNMHYLEELDWQSRAKYQYLFVDDKDLAKPKGVADKRSVSL